MSRQQRAPKAKLPLSKLEARAVAHVKKQVALIHRGGSPWSNDSPFSPEGGQRMTERLLHTVADFSAEGANTVAMLATLGQPEAIAATRLLSKEVIRHQRPMPLAPHLWAFMEDNVDGRKPALRPGPSSAKTMLRDLQFAMLVADVCDEFGLMPTGGSPRYRSGCEIVAQALALHGCPAALLPSPMPGESSGRSCREGRPPILVKPAARCGSKCSTLTKSSTRSVEESGS